MPRVSSASSCAFALALVGLVCSAAGCSLGSSEPLVTFEPIGTEHSLHVTPRSVTGSLVLTGRDAPLAIGDGARPDGTSPDCFVLESSFDIGSSAPGDQALPTELPVRCGTYGEIANATISLGDLRDLPDGPTAGYGTFSDAHLGPQGQVPATCGGGAGVDRPTVVVSGARGGRGVAPAPTTTDFRRHVHVEYLVPASPGGVGDPGCATLTLDFDVDAASYVWAAKNTAGV